MKSFSLMVVSVLVLVLAACSPGPSTNLPSTPAASPGGVSAGPDSAEARAATALVRAGAVEPKPIAGAPISMEGELKGGTFHVFSVRSTETSTRLEFVITHPTLSGRIKTLFENARSPMMPKLSVGGVDYLITEYEMGRTSWGDVMGTEYVVVPQPHPLFASYAPLPKGVAEVEVSTPLIVSPLRVRVDDGADLPPQGSADVPILGRVVYGDNGDPTHKDPLIVTLHGVRRLEKATAVYYSTAFTKGAVAVDMSRWGNGSNLLRHTWTSGDYFAHSIGILDHRSKTGYSQFGTTNIKQGCNIFDISKATARGAAVCWALLPPLAAGTSRVDVILGGQMLLQDVPVSSGVMVPESTEEIPMLGAGWPRIPAESLGLASAESFERATSRLRYVVKEGAITTSGEQLDLDSTVLFDYNRASLTAAAQGVLVKAAQQVKASGRAGVVSVIGHTDSDGSDGANLELSKRRAQAVADALSPLLGAGYTFSVDGKGEADPVAPNDTDAGKAANRRVTILPPK